MDNLGCRGLMSQPLKEWGEVLSWTFGFTFWHANGRSSHVSTTILVGGNGEELH